MPVHRIVNQSASSLCKNYSKSYPRFHHTFSSMRQRDNNRIKKIEQCVLSVVANYVSSIQLLNKKLKYEVFVEKSTIFCSSYQLCLIV